MTKGYPRCSWLLFTIGAFALPALVHSADSGAQDNEQTLNEIIVTAEKFKQPLQNVPITVTELTAVDLARANLTTTSDLPTLVSGLVWSNQGGWVLPSLRGVSSTVSSVTAPSPIAIYLDGVYQPFIENTLADVPDVSRIEVLKGPQGTLYGMNAVGGAISIYTLDPSFTPTGKFDVTSGLIGGGSSRDSGHYSASGFVSGPLVGDKLAGSISGYYNYIDGYLTNDLNGSRGGRIDAENVRGKLLWNPTDGISILATAYYLRREDGTAEASFPFGGLTVASFYPGSIIPTQPWHYAYDSPAPNVVTNVRGASLKGTFDLSLGTLTSITAYTSNSYEAIIDSGSAYTPGCVEIFVCVVSTVNEPQEAWTQSFDFASRQIGRFRFLAGLFGLYEHALFIDTFDATDFTTTFRINTAQNAFSYAGYGELTYDVTDKLSAIAGVRVTHDALDANGSFFDAPLVSYANSSWNAATPRFSLLYKIDSSLNSYFTFSKGFKGGVVPAAYTPNIQPASPENLYSYELGLKLARPRYRADLAAYYYDYRDLQVQSLTGTGGTVTLPQNAATAKIIGVDFDGEIKWSDSFETKLNTTYLARAEYTSFPNAIAYAPPFGPTGFVTDYHYDASGSRLLNAPLWTGTISGTYTKTFASGVLEATASLYYSSAYQWAYNNAVATGGYTQLSSRVSFSPKTSNFKYTLYGKNLTNKAYVSGITATPDGSLAFYGQPREVGITIGYSF